MTSHRNPRILGSLIVALVLGAALPAGGAEAQTVEAQPMAVFGSPGTSVLIKGGNFGTTTAPPQVTFRSGGSTAVINQKCSVLVAAPCIAGVSNTTITVKAPPDPGTVDPNTISVQTAAGAAATDATLNGPSFYYGPVITGLSHNYGPVGGTIVIKGGNLSGRPTITFVSGATSCSANATGTPTSTALPVQIPACSGTDPFQVQVSFSTGGGPHGTTTTTALYASPSAGDFYYSPVINGLNKNYAKWSTASSAKTVVIKGGNFGTSGTPVSVSFGGVPAVHVSHDATAITATLPQQPVAPPSDPVTVSVNVNGNQAATSSLTANQLYFGPVINGFNHNFGQAGTSTSPKTVVIKGGNFGTDRTAVQVSFAGTPTVVNSVTPTTISAIIPPLSSPPTPAQVSVQVGATAADLSTVSAANFYYGPVINQVK